MENKLKNPALLWLTAALCCLLWGSAFPFIKLGYEAFSISENETASIILFAGVRFFLAGILTILIFSLIRKKPLVPKKTAVKKIAVLSVFQTVLQYIFFYLGLAYISGGKASVINGSSVFFAIFISSLVFKNEKLKAVKIIGSIIGFAGVVLVSVEGLRTGVSSFKGGAFIIVSSVSYAFSSNFIKLYSKDEDPAMLSGWQFALGGAVMTAFGLIFGGRLEAQNVKGIAIIIYLALVSAVAYTLWSLLLKYNEVSRVAVCSFMTPVFGYILSSLLTDSEGGSIIISFASLLLVSIGIASVNYSFKSEKK